MPQLTGDWTELLDLEDWEGYWQCTDLPWLRLHERKISDSDLPLEDVLTLAALWGDLPAILTAEAEDLAVTIRPDEDEARTQDGAIFFLHRRVRRFASRYALSVLLRELDEQLAATRDLSERATSQRSPEALTQVQQQLIRTGLDSQIVAADISRYASNATRWKRDGLRQSRISGPSGTLNPPADHGRIHAAKPNQPRCRSSTSRSRPAGPHQLKRPAHRRRRKHPPPALGPVASLGFPWGRPHRGSSHSRRPIHLQPSANPHANLQPSANRDTNRTPQYSPDLAREHIAPAMTRDPSRSCRARIIMDQTPSYKRQLSHGAGRVGELTLAELLAQAQSDQAAGRMPVRTALMALPDGQSQPAAGRGWHRSRPTGRGAHRGAA